MLIDKLKQILVSNQSDIEKYKILKRPVPDADFDCKVFVGVRRSGKSFMLYQKMQEMLSGGHGWDEMLYLNFEDDRLDDFTSEDFDLILESHAQLYDKRPMLFLDEIHNIDGWEKFARRLADKKYRVWITGSNAKMLSKQIMSALGGRYLPQEVYPFSFTEFMRSQDIRYDQHALLGIESRAKVMRAWNEYLHWGGLPESIDLTVKRNYISSTFQKIYLGDICSRNNVANSSILRLMIKKMAENICQPISHTRLSNILSSVNGKISVPTVGKYIEHCEDAWLLLRLRNVSAPFAEKETACKYYFIDNGVLNLFLLNGETALLENMVALSLFRKYGHDEDNERVFFYNDRIEVDFYIPEDKLAIQASYSIAGSQDTYEREVNALKKLPKVLECKRRVILTYEEESSITDDFGEIEVIPLWKWLLEPKNDIKSLY